MARRSKLAEGIVLVIDFLDRLIRQWLKYLWIGIKKTWAFSTASIANTIEASAQKINVNRLGVYLDGWADLIEGMGGKADPVRQEVQKILQDRQMPQIDHWEGEGFISAFSDERRPYTLTQTAPGATTTIYIGKHGTDLYVAWRTFIHPVLNIVLLLVMLGLVILAGTSSYDWMPYQRYLPDVAIPVFVITLILEILLVGTISRMAKGNFFQLFFLEPNIFDAEDITAMGLSVHKSLLRALDTTGIDISKLRLKQNFKGGRRGEEI